jgi:hypothetical protein
MRSLQTVNRFLALALVALLMQSCAETRIRSGNVLYRYDRTVGTSGVTKHLVNVPTQAKKIEEGTGFLKVTFANPPGFPTVGAQIGLAPSDITARGVGSTNSTTYHFLEESDDNITNPSGYQTERFRYFTRTYGIQSVSIPIKFRGRQGVNNAIPANVETSLNLGAALVMKNTWNAFRLKANFLNRKTTQISLSPGIGIGFGTTDLDPTVNAPGLGSKRKSATFNYSGFFMLGLNNIHFGYAVGFDKALGAGGSRWTYDNVVWQGIVLSIDLLKF